VKILDRDFVVAGIPKADDRGRTVDFHSLRHTFGTLLSVGGVNPRTAQQAMRHSDIKLTMNIYTDPRLLDVAGAVDALPMLRLSTEPTLPNPRRHQATGTAGRKSLVTPSVTPTVVRTGPKESISDQSGAEQQQLANEQNPAKSQCFTGFLPEPARGVEPLTPALRMRCSAD
jgi:hypothetical protein